MTICPVSSFNLASSNAAVLSLSLVRGRREEDGFGLTVTGAKFMTSRTPRTCLLR